MPEEERYIPETGLKPRKKRGCLITVIVLLMILVLGGVLIYFMVPGFFRPYDLGIRPTKEGYESAMNKLSIIKDEAPKEGSAEDYIIEYGTPVSVQTSLTEEEITSWLNINRPDYYALKNVQVRINEDNSVEASGSIDVEYVLEEIMSNRYNKEDIKKAIPVLGILPDKVNLYIKAEGGIEHNQVTNLSLDKVSVMGITIPDSMVNSEQADNVIEESLNSYMNKINEKSGTSYDLLEVSNGSLILQGQIASSISRIPVN